MAIILIFFIPPSRGDLNCEGSGKWIRKGGKTTINRYVAGTHALHKQWDEMRDDGLDVKGNKIEGGSSLCTSSQK